MAVVMIMQWPGVTPDQYEHVRNEVPWETDQPAGGLGHIAWFEDDGLHVIDVWESPEAFGAFQAERLAPGVQAAGIAGEPDVRFTDLHAQFIPDALK